MSTATPFAQSIDSTNAAVIAALANAQVIIGGVQTAAVFDNGYSAGNVGGNLMGGMANTQAALTIESHLVPENYDGQEVLINGESYLIADVQPDGLGVSRVYLEQAA